MGKDNQQIPQFVLSADDPQAVLALKNYVKITQGKLHDEAQQVYQEFLAYQKRGA